MNETQVLRALKETAEFLASQEIDFAIIGGIAVAVRGEPRATLDVDAVLKCDVERALALLQTLHSAPVAPFFDGVEEIVRTGLLLPLEHKDTGIRIDLSIGMSGFDQQVVANASSWSIDGQNIPVASAEYLVVMKQLAARPRDLDDIEGILTRQGARFDWPLTLRLAEELSEAVDDDVVTPLQRAKEKTEGR